MEMKIAFTDMEGEILPAFKGGEKEYRAKRYGDEACKIMSGRLIPGASIGYHKHTEDYEVIFITAGEGKVLYDEEEIRLKAGDCHYCPQGHAHSLINDSDADLTFYAVVPVA